MRDEKMMILKMLEDGIISAQEAKELLESLESPRSSNANSENPKGRKEKISEQEEKIELEEFVSGLGRKFESFRKDFEPKLQKLTEIVVEKTATVADRFSKPFLDEAPPSHATEHKNILERTFGLKVAERYNDLKISSFNGSIRVNSCKGDNITVKVAYNPKIENATLNFLKREKEYILDYDENKFSFVSVDAFIPESLFRNVNIQCINGAVEVCSINVESYTTISGLNGSAKLKDIESGIIKVDVNNGSLDATNIISKSGKFEVSHGSIYCTGFDIEDLYIKAFNGSANVDIPELNRFKDYICSIDSSNGKTNISLPRVQDIGYHVKAQASLANAKVKLTNLDYIVDSHDFVEAKSINYDTYLKRVSINAKTSNAPLIIS